METLVELFKSSVIVQALLALLFAVTLCYMLIAGMEVPVELVALEGTIIGYYFGTKTMQRLNSR